MTQDEYAGWGIWVGRRFVGRLYGSKAAAERAADKIRDDIFKSMSRPDAFPVSVCWYRRDEDPR